MRTPARPGPARFTAFPSRQGRLLALAAIIAGLPSVVPAAASLAAGSIESLKRLSLEELMELEVISVSRHPEKLIDAASAIQVVTSEEIIRSGATSLPEALRLAGNLNVAQKNPRDWGISARGFNAALGNKLLVMIDGRTVYSPLFSGVFWDVQDYLLEDVDRIEVVSGPGSTLWGANAVNGVINIVSKNARDTQGLYAAAGAGSELSSFANVRYGTALAPNVFLRVYGKFFDRDNAVRSDGGELPDSWSMRRGGFRLDAEGPPGSAVTVQGDLYDGSEYIVTGGIQKISGGNLLGRWSHTLAEDSAVTLQAYYDHTHLVDPITNRFGTAQNITDDLDTFDLDFQHNFPLGARHRVLWGLGYRLTRDDVANAPNTAFLPARVDHQLFSAFLQDEIALRPSLSLILGAKVEHNDYTGLETEPTIRLEWNVRPNQTLWAAVSRAVRMPSRIDRDIYQPRPPPLVASGGRHFRSETVVAYELGGRSQLGENAFGSLSLFYNEYDHVRSFGPTPVTTLPYFFANNLEGETYGLELSVTYRVRPGWQLRGGYSLLKEDLRVKPGQIDLFNALNETSDPEHQFSLRSSFDLPASATLDTGLRWVDTLPTTTGTVPSYFELDVRLAWHPTDHLELALVGQNLLHDHHPEFGIDIARREEIQRSVYAQLAWRY